MNGKFLNRSRGGGDIDREVGSPAAPRRRCAGEKRGASHLFPRCGPGEGLRPVDDGRLVRLLVVGTRRLRCRHSRGDVRLSRSRTISSSSPGEGRRSLGTGATASATTTNVLDRLIRRHCGGTRRGWGTSSSNGTGSQESLGGDSSLSGILLEDALHG